MLQYFLRLTVLDEATYTHIMKLFLSILFMFCFSAASASAADTTASPETGTVKGEVLEVTNVVNYTYLLLKTKDGETWAAVSSAPVAKGDQVTIEDATVMDNFVSKALNKTFDKIVFGTVGGVRATPLAAAGVPETADAAYVKVPKADGPDARTVAEIVTKSADLKDKTIRVRGKVVKYNASVMGKNWIHLRDGSGSDSDNSNDVLVTTNDQAKLGDVVIAKGVVHTDKDFGAGYSYKVLVEDATLQN